MKPTFIDRAAKALMHKKDKSLENILDKSDYERMERIILADRLLIQWRSDTTTAKALVRYYEAQDIKYSISSAYRDINYAKQLFGNLRLTHKNYERYLLREITYKWIKKWEEDVSGNKMALNQAVKNLIQLGRLDKEEEEGIDPALLGRHPIIYSDDVQDIGLRRDPKNKEYVESILNQYYTPEEIEFMKDKYKPLTEDVEFEIVDDGKKTVP